MKICFDLVTKRQSSGYNSGTNDAPHDTVLQVYGSSGRTLSSFAGIHLTKTGTMSSYLFLKHIDNDM